MGLINEIIKLGKRGSVDSLVVLANCIRLQTLKAKALNEFVFKERPLVVSIFRVDARTMKTALLQPFGQEKNKGQTPLARTSAAEENARLKRSRNPRRTWSPMRVPQQGPPLNRRARRVKAWAIASTIA